MFGLGRAPAPAPADAVPYLPSSPGQQSESAEIAELQQLFSSRGPYPPPRDSTIPKSTLAKLKVGEELLLHADEARQEKEDRRRVREAQMSERLARAQTRREESKQRTERCRAAREAERMRKLEICRAVRADEEAWEKDRERQLEQHYTDVRARVEAAAGGYSSVDARLDAQEEEADQIEREEGTRMRLELKKTIADMRTLTLSNKKQGAESSRERRTRGLERAAKQQALLKRLAADEKRAEAKAWLLERRHNESLHLSKAQNFKSQVAQSRMNARTAQESTFAQRKQAALKEKHELELLHQEKARILAANKELVAYTYRSKFASSKEAEEWGASTLLQFRSDYFGREPLLPHAEEPPLALTQGGSVTEVS